MATEGNSFAGGSPPASLINKAITTKVGQGLPPVLILATNFRVSVIFSKNQVDEKTFAFCARLSSRDQRFFTKGRFHDDQKDIG